MRSGRLQVLAGWGLAFLGLAHIGLTFASFEHASLDALWFAGSGALVMLIGALDIVVGNSPERFLADARSVRAVVIGANVAGIVLAAAFMWIQSGLAFPGPLLLLLFGIAAGAQAAAGGTYQR
jgi:hypothetical protein